MPKFNIVSKNITKADKITCKTWYIAKKETDLTDEWYKENFLRPVLEFFDEDIESVYSQYRDVVFAGSSYTSINMLVRLRDDCKTMYRIPDLKAKIGTCQICPIVREDGNDIVTKFFARRNNGYDIRTVDVNPDDDYVAKFNK